MRSSTLAALALLSSLISCHGVIVAATGDQGGSGTAIGVDPNVPRTGTDRRPFQEDTTVFDGDAEFACGETLQTEDADTVNDIPAGVTRVMELSGGKKLPQVSQGGEVRMTLHQVNADGAGPYVCMIDASATGANWVGMNVTTQVPGRRGNDRDGEVTDFPLVAAVAQDQTCTGTVAGQSGVCMVRCQNPQGPFGGCVPVQLADAQRANAKVKVPKVSETGGTAEDDVDAIVEAAEDAEDGGSLLDRLFGDDRRIRGRVLGREARQRRRQAGNGM